MERALIDLVWQRAGGRCEYCQLAQEDLELPFEIDHIRAKKHHGRTVPGNLCLACLACNNHKGPNISGVDPMTDAIVPLFNPRRHKWHVHFRWDGCFRAPSWRADIARRNSRGSAAPRGTGVIRTGQGARNVATGPCGRLNGCCARNEPRVLSRAPYFFSFQLTIDHFLG